LDAKAIEAKVMDFGQRGLLSKESSQICSIVIHNIASLASAGRLFASIGMGSDVTKIQPSGDKLLAFRPVNRDGGGVLSSAIQLLRVLVLAALD
jgi:hypothetical protein